MTRDEFKTRITIVAGLMSVFAALDVALSALPGWWISWAAIIKPLYGIMLGPVAGPCAAIIGGIIGNFIWPHTAVLAVFTWVPGILGALASGIIVKGEKSHLWTFALAVHATLISAFYLHPVGNTVALWALYDKVIALALIFPTVKIVKKSRISEGESLDVKWLLPALALTSFIGTEADDITGNVIFMYLELYKLFGIPPEALPPLYVAGAVIMPLQRVLVAIIATLVAVPLFKAFEKSALIRWPLT
jgi:MFS family permease